MHILSEDIYLKKTAIFHWTYIFGTRFIFRIQLFLRGHLFLMTYIFRGHLFSEDSYF